ncbi:MAG: hypothetical protein RIQ73_321, partial [Actinomycetota bacterium]
HLGDMDFKVVGTGEGITSLQMDIKIDGVDRQIMGKALAQAKEGRVHILTEMKKSISKSRDEVAEHAPKYMVHKINPDKIREALSAMNILVEEWGGKYQSQEISSKSGMGVNELLEKVLLEAEILDLIRGLKDRLNSAVLLITHDMGVVADLADDILVMKDGICVESGTADQIFNRPAHPYTQQLLAAVPRLGSVAVRELSREQKALAPVLKLKNVSIEYPKNGRIPAFRAVTDFTLEIFPGEIVGLVGESGSGKTTVGRAAIGLLPAVEGTIEIVGRDISKPTDKELREIRRHTGIVFQDPASSLNPRLPIGESIGEPLFLSGDAKGAALDKAVEELLDQVELPRSYRNRYPHELSGGQRQRVGIARALALTPDLLIADEPTSALDVSVQARFLDLLQELQGKLNFACLFISHDLAVVDILAHRIAVMHDGFLVEVGERDQILKNPQHDYTKLLISGVPVPDPAEQRIRREARLALKR